MYAIVEINGQQFKVEEGKKLFVNHMRDVEAGKTVEFDKVLLVDNEGTVQVGAPTVSGAKVVCEVVNPLVKGEKVIVFKMKRRKDSRKRNGHRQQYTQVEVGSKHNAGNGVAMGKDDTLYALVDGTVQFRKGKRDKSYVSVIPEPQA